MKCHCGAEALEGGNGLANICRACFDAWMAAGEPVQCPCLDDFAPAHGCYCVNVEGCPESKPCHPCAYWMARARHRPCPACLAGVTA